MKNLSVIGRGSGLLIHFELSVMSGLQTPRHAISARCAKFGMTHAASFCLVLPIQVIPELTPRTPQSFEIRDSSRVHNKSAAKEFTSASGELQRDPG